MSITWGIFFECYFRRYAYSEFILFFQGYSEHINKINNYLYKKLNKSDKNLFIRFLLKRFYGVNTASKEEIRIIDEAFNKTMELFPAQADGNEYAPIRLNLSFKGKHLLFNMLDKPKGAFTTHNQDEKKLMRFFEPAHAFFLTEYYMEGYNPEDGKVIFDCGGAHGDTLLLFKTLYPKSYVYTFECVERNALLINKNITDNSLTECSCYTGYLYSDSGVRYKDKNTGCIVSEKTENSEIIKTVAIDDFVRENNIRNIGLIKFDIEGGEQEALKGAINTIKTQKPLLYIPIYHLESDIYKIPEFLSSLNIPMTFRLKWTEKKVWGVDCVLFVRFEND